LKNSKIDNLNEGGGEAGGVEIFLSDSKAQEADKSLDPAIKSRGDE
jgi:hypothetical protein